VTRTLRSSVHDLDTPVGAARAHVTALARPRALVVLGHGAGRGVDTQDLLGLAEALPRHGVSVVLVDQPWVLAGRRVAAPPATVDVAWLAVLAALRGDPLRAATGAHRRTPVVVGGRSAGARVACRTAVGSGADAVLLLAHPLLPPAARREGAARERALGVRRSELALPLAAGIPVVAAQGERDAFGSPAELAAALGCPERERDAPGGGHRTTAGPPSVDVLAVPAADHSLRAARGGPDPAPVLLEAALLAVARAGGE
jgi:predicted alpha/beta-hydrolase family hydrolase